MSALLGLGANTANHTAEVCAGIALLSGYEG